MNGGSGAAAAAACCLLMEGRGRKPAGGSTTARISTTLRADAYAGCGQHLCRWFGVIHKGVV